MSCQIAMARSKFCVLCPMFFWILLTIKGGSLKICPKSSKSWHHFGSFRVLQPMVTIVLVPSFWCVKSVIHKFCPFQSKHPRWFPESFGGYQSSSSTFSWNFPWVSNHPAMESPRKPESSQFSSSFKAPDPLGGFGGPRAFHACRGRLDQCYFCWFAMAGNGWYQRKTIGNP